MRKKKRALPVSRGRLFFATSWWTILFCALCILLDGQAIREKNRLQVALEQRLSDLEDEKRLALQDREDLLLQLDSQSDPAWIEMTLMKGLGVVPEGQMKVYFKSE